MKKYYNVVMKKKLTKKEMQQVVALLDEHYEDAKTFLTFQTPFQLLVAVILSAQCTDVRVNKVTQVLFAVASTPQEIVDLGQDRLKEIIRSCGLYETKSKNIILASQMILGEFGGEVPSDMETLMRLPGVGRKTANVVMCNAFEKDAIAVDTHVFRVSNRIGLAQAANVYQTELQLMKNIDQAMWGTMHHKIILHGRRMCTARKPKCEECFLTHLCLHCINEKRGG